MSGASCVIWKQKTFGYQASKLIVEPLHPSQLVESERFLGALFIYLGGIVRCFSVAFAQGYLHNRKAAKLKCKREEVIGKHLSPQTLML